GLPSNSDALGFMMRWPDYSSFYNSLGSQASNPITNNSTVTNYLNDANNYNVNYCNTASKATVVDPHMSCIPVNTTHFPDDTIQIHVYVKDNANHITQIACVPAIVTVGSPVPKCPGINGVGECYCLPSPSVVLYDIATAINNSTCNPVGYSASV